MKLFFSVLVILIIAFTVTQTIYALDATRDIVSRPVVQHSNTYSPINVSAGQNFKILLESNPTTGYKWQLARPLDRSMLKLVNSSYKAGGGNLVGSGGNELWTFKAKNPGKAKIYFEYVRPWKDEDKQEESTKKTFTVHIK